MIQRTSTQGTALWLATALALDQFDIYFAPSKNRIIEFLIP